MNNLTDEQMEQLHERASELIVIACDGRRYQEAMRYISVLTAKIEKERDKALADNVALTAENANLKAYIQINLR